MWRFMLSFKSQWIWCNKNIFIQLTAFFGKVIYYQIWSWSCSSMRSGCWPFSQLVPPHSLQAAEPSRPRILHVHFFIAQPVLVVHLTTGRISVALLNKNNPTKIHQILTILVLRAFWMTISISDSLKKAKQKSVCHLGKAKPKSSFCDIIIPNKRDTHFSIAWLVYQILNVILSYMASVSVSELIHAHREATYIIIPGGLSFICWFCLLLKWVRNLPLDTRSPTLEMGQYKWLFASISSINMLVIIVCLLWYKSCLYHPKLVLTRMGVRQWILSVVHARVTPRHWCCA